VGSKYDLLRWTACLYWERVHTFSIVLLIVSRLALLEIRLLLASIICKYESWTGVPNKPGNWDEEMKPYETMVTSPSKEKCIIKFKPRQEGM